MSELEDSYSFPYTESDYYLEGSVSHTFTDRDFLTLEEESLPEDLKRFYHMLTRSEVEVQRSKAIAEVTSTLGVDQDVALRLLRKFNWHEDRITEQWFEDMERVQQDLGFTCAGPSQSCQEVCPICLTSTDLEFLPCNHGACKSCWRQYLATAVEKGPACLDVRCPMPDCNYYIPESFFAKHADQKDMDKFKEFSIRSFIDDNPRVSWCPGQNCGKVAECRDHLSSTEAVEVHCSCGEVFCFKCHEEGHRPVDCDTIRKWKMKICDEGENTEYILAYTKPCPKCKVPIEKNQGCMHMTCSQCRHEFCWLCLGDWSAHGEETGGYYQCNGYEARRREGQLGEEEEKRENARIAVERFSHYFERWSAHDRAHRKAIEHRDCVERDQEVLPNMEKGKTTSLLGKKTDVTHIKDAWDQVVECRRMLKYSYVYGFYTFLDDASRNKKQFFEFLQGDAENSLERLHASVEVKLQQMMEGVEFEIREPGDEPLWKKFDEHRSMLLTLTKVTEGFFRKLVDQLEKGIGKFGSLEISMSIPEQTETSNEVATPEQIRAREASQGFWVCNACTFVNTNLNTEQCEICATARGAPAPEAQPQDEEGQPQDGEAHPQGEEGQPQNDEAQPQDVEGQPQDVEGQPQDVEGQPQDEEAQPQDEEAHPQGEQAQGDHAQGEQAHDNHAQGEQAQDEQQGNQNDIPDLEEGHGNQPGVEEAQREAQPQEA